jgi:hypothetical protein
MKRGFGTHQSCIYFMVFNCIFGAEESLKVSWPTFGTCIRPRAENDRDTAQMLRSGSGIAAPAFCFGIGLKRHVGGLDLPI